MLKPQFEIAIQPPSSVLEARLRARLGLEPVSDTNPGEETLEALDLLEALRRGEPPQPEDGIAISPKALSLQPYEMDTAGWYVCRVWGQQLNKVLISLVDNAGFCMGPTCAWPYLHSFQHLSTQTDPVHFNYDVLNLFYMELGKYWAKKLDRYQVLPSPAGISPSIYYRVATEQGNVIVAAVDTAGFRDEPMADVIAEIIRDINSGAIIGELPASMHIHDAAKRVGLLPPE